MKLSSIGEAGLEPVSVVRGGGRWRAGVGSWCRVFSGEVRVVVT